MAPTPIRTTTARPRSPVVCMAYATSSNCRRPSREPTLLRPATKVPCATSLDSKRTRSLTHLLLLGTESRLPSNLYEAAKKMRSSPIAKELFGEEFVDHYSATRLWEWKRFQKAVTTWELDRYFELA